MHFNIAKCLFFFLHSFCFFQNFYLNFCGTIFGPIFPDKTLYIFTIWTPNTMLLIATYHLYSCWLESIWRACKLCIDCDAFCLRDIVPSNRQLLCTYKHGFCGCFFWKIPNNLKKIISKQTNREQVERLLFPILYGHKCTI